MMRRFSEAYLEQWLSRTQRKPLILRGARQVGKSTLVRNGIEIENGWINVPERPGLGVIPEPGVLRAPAFSFG